MGRAFLVQNEVTVNFVGYQDKVVAFAEFGKLEDFSSREDPSKGVLRVTEKKHPCVGANRFFHGFPIKYPLRFIVDVGNSNKIEPCIPVDVEEGRINWGACQNRVSRFGKCTAGQRKRRNESSQVYQLIGRGRKAMSQIEVIKDGLNQAIVR